MPVSPALFQIAEALGEVIGRRLVAQWAAEGRFGVAPTRAAVARARPQARPALKPKVARTPRPPRVKESLAGLEPGMTVDFRTRKAEGVGSILTLDEMAVEVSVLDLRTRQVHQCRPSEVQVRKAVALPPQKRRRAEAETPVSAPAVPDTAPELSPVMEPIPAASDANGARMQAGKAPPLNIVPLEVPSREPEPAAAAPSPVEMAIAEAAARLRRNG